MCVRVGVPLPRPVPLHDLVLVGVSVALILTLLVLVLVCVGVGETRAVGVETALHTPAHNDYFILSYYFDVDDVDEKVKKAPEPIEILRRKSLGFGLHHLHQIIRILFSILSHERVEYLKSNVRDT